MAQPTAANAISIARILAQDTATSAPAVADSDAVVLLADVLLRYNGDVEQKQKLLSATASGLTYAANATVMTTTEDVGEILAAHPSDSASVNTLQSPALDLWTVRDMLDVYSDAGSGAGASGASTEFKAFAWEKVQEGTASEAAQVYVWPPCNRTRYLTLRTAPYDVVSSTSTTLDLNPRALRIVARFLAWEMARLHTRDEAFLQQILAPVPDTVLKAYFQSGVKASFGTSGVKQTSQLDG